MLHFNKTYFGLTMLLFITEVLIALYVHDNFIRPYIGDVLVVILIYCFIKSFLKLKVLTAVVLVLLFSFGIETLQYLNIVEKLRLENNTIARTVIGTSFSWMDILSYVAGLIIVLVVEKSIKKNQ